MQLYCKVSQSKLVMGVKRPEGLLAKQAVLAPQVPPSASHPALSTASFPHKMSPTKRESTQLSLLGNQNEYKRCKLLRWPQLCGESSVSPALGPPLTDPRERPVPPASGASLPPSRSPFQRPPGSFCPRLCSTVSVQMHSFLIPGAKYLPGPFSS